VLGHGDELNVLLGTALQIPDSRAWKFSIDVSAVEVTANTITRKFNIICIVSGVWDIKVVAETGQRKGKSSQPINFSQMVRI
jgi:hypothetical protein